jgi:hypothetical protein
MFETLLRCHFSSARPALDCEAVLECECRLTNAFLTSGAITRRYVARQGVARQSGREGVLILIVASHSEYLSQR